MYVYVHRYSYRFFFTLRFIEDMQESKKNVKLVLFFNITIAYLFIFEIVALFQEIVSRGKTGSSAKICRSFGRFIFRLLYKKISNNALMSFNSALQKIWTTYASYILQFSSETHLLSSRKGLQNFATFDVLDFINFFSDDSVRFPTLFNVSSALDVPI